MRFDYLEPKTIKEAITILKEHKGKAKIIAGGTDVMLQARSKAIKPEVLVDITNIPDMDYIKFDDKKGLRIGALATIRDLETSKQLREKYPVIACAASQLGSVAIRNVATLGGNLCNALPSAETAQVMLALSAQAKILGTGGERQVAFSEFFTGAGKTVLKEDEILLEVIVPRLLPNTRGIYIKHSPRGTIDLAVINITVLVTMGEDNITCKEASIVLGTVAPTPIRAKQAESLLRGKRIDDTLIEQAAQAASDEAHPREGSIRGSVEYKKEMVKVLTIRALKEATGQEAR